MTGRTMLPRLALLFLLYVVQGLPFGFQSQALPALLRAGGTSLTIITLASALSFPWLLKALWAPLVERAFWPRVGRRRSWILPMQLVLALLCAAAAFAPPDDALIALLALILAMNMVTALMDVAVDGLAVDSLERRHLGYGNIAQVVGYKLGMIVSGGLLLAWIATIGWSGMFAIMAALALAGFTVTLGAREHGASEPGPPPRPIGLGTIVALVLSGLRSRTGRWVLILVATYKLGETMADALFVPFLVDAGFAPEQIGLWRGTYGMIASIAGSVAGGVVASRVPLVSAVAVLAAIRALSVAGEWWLTLIDAPTAGAVLVVTVAEELAGGALTTATFAFMMSQVDRRVGAAHFTVLATIEVLGKMAIRMVAGPLAESTSYAVVFGLATATSIAFLGVVAITARRLHAP